MTGQIVCPRCGARDSFMKGYLPETCVCRVCQSQLGWQEISGCGPDCKAVEVPGASETVSGQEASERAVSGEVAADEGKPVGGAAGR